MEGFENPGLLIGVDADAGIPDRRQEGYAIFSAFGQRQLDEDLAALGEFHRVADEVDQHLPQPRRVAGEPPRHILGNEINEFEPLAGAALAKQIGHLGNQFARVEVDHRELKPPGFDLREVEDIVDDPQQSLTGSHEVFDELGLALVERRRRQQGRRSEHPVHRRADLVAHRREELRLGAVCRLRLPPPVLGVILQHLAARDFRFQALRELYLPPGEGRHQGDHHDQDDEDRDQGRQKHRRHRHVGQRRIRQREEDRRLHRRVVHAGDREPHDRSGGHRRQHARRTQPAQAKANAERDKGQSDRDDDRDRDQQRVIAQQRFGLHRRHSRVVHQADAGPHQHGAHRQTLETRLRPMADDPERDPAGEDARDHRGHRADRVVADPARQREGEHADEMHPPNAAAHRRRPGAGPGPAGTARGGGDNARRSRQGDKGRQGGDDDRQRDQPGGVGVAIGRRRIDRVENREKSPIKVQHARLAMKADAHTIATGGEKFLNGGNFRDTMSQRQCRADLGWSARG